ncbi:hypothetical protein Adeh_1409 [Anaeromyxobacter dehalogenans 2CP-C]|uniref:Uncharacterized protein n=1 Tax=Anaeromyxobacter dehalogenans (strain 2CP-C) TaxID=290397 RepID=Q2IQV0_ANADE|nr:hypothetical protein Adeh_1409 [Anaeromyxobacter dehalogenans 2CP-C]
MANPVSYDYLQRSGLADGASVGYLSEPGHAAVREEPAGRRAGRSGGLPRSGGRWPVGCRSGRGCFETEWNIHSFSRRRIPEPSVAQREDSGRGPLCVRKAGWTEAPLSRTDAPGTKFFETNSAGKRTSRMVQWHPGGGHHGSDPYWKVSSPETGTVRVGPQFEK